QTKGQWSDIDCNWNIDLLFCATILYKRLGRRHGADHTRICLGRNRLLHCISKKTKITIVKTQKEYFSYLMPKLSLWVFLDAQRENIWKIQNKRNRFRPQEKKTTKRWQT